MVKDKELSWYMEKLLKSEFLQFDLLEPDDFVRYLRDRDIHIRREDLEFFEKSGILLPVLRLHRPIVNRPHQKYAALVLGSYGLKAAYEDGLLEFPRAGHFKPWKEYRDGYEEKTWLFYHPFQTIIIGNFLYNLRMSLRADYFDDIEKAAKSIQKLREYMKSKMKLVLDFVPYWNKRIGLLMLLQEPYQFQTTGKIAINPWKQNATVRDWVRWKQKRFKPESILKLSGLSIDEIKKFYERLASSGYTTDPLADWFVLTKIIRRSRKQKLKGKALLAQDYYEAARMVSLFLEDLTHKKQIEPDDLMDGTGGAWKPDIFGKPFDYSTKGTHRAIAQYYLLPQFIRLLILVEGPTEEKVLSMIFDALYVNTEQASIMVHPYGGIDNLKRKNIDDMLKMTNEDEIPVFVIADNEKNANSKLEALVTRGKIKNGMYKIWKGDFEQDNFGTPRVIRAVNDKLKPSGKKIDAKQVKELMKKQSLNLMNAISKVYGAKHHQGLDEVISKPILAEALFKNRAKEIRREYNKGGSKNKLPIEKVLNELLKLITEYL